MEFKGGVFRQVQLPKSSVYVSAEPDQTEPQKQKYKFASTAGAFHFFLALTSGENYTSEEIENCQGKYRCYNCQRPIPGAMYFYPEQFHFQTNEPTCNPIPHCRPECVLRTLHDMPNKDELLTNFFLMYGHEYLSAPPRFLLHIPGGLTIEAYHKTIDEGFLMDKQDPLVRGLMAPVFVSCTLFKDHRLVPETIGLLAELSRESTTTIGPSRNRDDSGLEVVALKPESLTGANIAQVFQFDPASFRPGPEK